MFDIYKIKDADLFEIHRYPEIESEMAIVSKHLDKLPAGHQAEIIISFLKDHCIKTSWLHGNEDFVKMIRSGFLNMSKTEALFNACRQHRHFVDGLEQYISSALRNSAN